MERLTLKNAVFLKDISVKAKKKNMALSLFILNLLIGFGSMLFFMISNFSLARFDSFNIQIFTWVFDAFIIIECAVICIMLPGETAPAISNERERQTLDVLLTTNLSNLDIILGKYLSSLLYMLLIIVSLIPFLSVILFYGGISFTALIGITLSVIATAMYLSCFGIYFSTIVKKSSHAAAVNLAVVFLIVLGSIFFCLVTKLISEIFTGAIYNAPSVAPSFFRSGDWCLFILYLNPASTVFDVLDKLVGFNVNNTFKGMSMIFEEFSHLNPENFFIKHWAPIGFALQFAIGFLVLKGAAASLKTTRRHNNRGKKDHH